MESPAWGRLILPLSFSGRAGLILSRTLAARVCVVFLFIYFLAADTENETLTEKDLALLSVLAHRTATSAPHSGEMRAQQDLVSRFIF